MNLPDYIPPGVIDDDIRRWLGEDLGSGDVTTAATVAPAQSATATFIAKEDGVVAGLAVAGRVFTLVDPEVSAAFTCADGDFVRAGESLGTVAGRASAILVGERLALNILQRMSGIASATRRMVQLAEPHGARILDTRKTAPGLRHLDKWAVLIGGGTNHRYGLHDMILVKDNHIAAAGGIQTAMDRAAAARKEANHELLIEVETRTLVEVGVAAGHPAVDRILLDNMVRVTDKGVDVSMLREAVAVVDSTPRDSARPLQTEASGNVTEATVAAIASTGVDFISSGALTHSVSALDISLKILLD